MFFIRLYHTHLPDILSTHICLTPIRGRLHTWRLSTRVPPASSTPLRLPARRPAAHQTPARPIPARATPTWHPPIWRSIARPTPARPSDSLPPNAHPCNAHLTPTHLTLACPPARRLPARRPQPVSHALCLSDFDWLFFTFNLQDVCMHPRIKFKN